MEQNRGAFERNAGAFVKRKEVAIFSATKRDRSNICMSLSLFLSLSLLVFFFIFQQITKRSHLTGTTRKPIEIYYRLLLIIIYAASQVCLRLKKDLRENCNKYRSLSLSRNSLQMFDLNSSFSICRPQPPVLIAFILGTCSRLLYGNLALTSEYRLSSSDTPTHVAFA